VGVLDWLDRLDRRALGDPPPVEQQVQFNVERVRFLERAWWIWFAVSGAFAALAIVLAIINEDPLLLLVGVVFAPFAAIGATLRRRTH
jgi:hypothetical protein